MKKIALVARHHCDESLQIFLRSLVSFLGEQGKEVFFTQSMVHVFEEDTEMLEKFSVIDSLENMNLVVFAGGDGTLLRLIQEFSPHLFSIPIVGIHAGKVGFFSSLSQKNAFSGLKNVFSGNGVVDKRMMMEGKIFEENRLVSSFFSLNECVVHHSGIARLREISAFLSGETLTNYRADGLIIATPTGSTAYNAAAGGPLVSPDQSAFILTPIAPSGFGHRPIVVASSHVVSLSVDEEMVVSVDGQEIFPFSKNSIMQISSCPKPLLFLRQSSESFYAALREKLHWGS